jgi:hypothetical protein
VHRSEIEDLQTRVSQERDKYQASTQGVSSTGYSAIPYFAVNDKVTIALIVATRFVHNYLTAI